jgi:hypothetical protein
MKKRPLVRTREASLRCVAAASPLLSAGGKMTSVRAEPKATAVLDEARQALARSDWEAAREQFERALEAEASAEALDGLGQTLGGWVRKRRRSS